jgi:hypothetical protein
MSEVELKLKSKNRKVWLVGILWMIVSGILFYFITSFVIEYKFPTLSLTYLTLFLLTFVVFTLTGVSLKAPMLSWRNAIIFPFGILITALLNETAPRWGYSNNVFSFYFSIFLFLLILYFFTGLAAVGITRLCVGYDLIPGFRGKIHGYTFSRQIDDASTLLEKLLYPFNIEKFRLYSRSKEWALFGFKLWPNRFLVYCKHYDERLLQMVFFGYRLSSDTVVQAEDESTESFFAALDGIVERWKEQGFIEEATIQIEPESSEEAKAHLLDMCINPVRFGIKIPSREYLIGILKALPKDHPYIFAFISTIAGTILATLVLKLLGY